MACLFVLFDLRLLEILFFLRFVLFCCLWIHFLFYIHIVKLGLMFESSTARYFSKWLKGRLHETIKWSMIIKVHNISITIISK
ncbi:hypothetical protein L1887_13782 [Cichorium endivia]|nr:hypothetical protein L1887_13782 [Cichorium endivia]